MLIREPAPPRLHRSRGRRHVARRRPFYAASVQVESLEPRSLMNASGPSGLGVSQVQVEPNDTLDQAEMLGDLSTVPQTDVIGTVGNGPAGAAGVDWYGFTLDGPATVDLNLQPRGTSHPLDGVLSLYNDDQGDWGDLYDPTGYRMLAQATSQAGAAPQIEQELSPGTYYIAVSGAGDLYFNPLLAGSGLAGATGDYDLQLSATALDFGPGDGPAVLTSDPAPNSVLSASPFVIRLDFSEPIDPSTINPGQTVSLTYNPTGNFGDGNDQSIALAWTNVGVNGTELQLAPNAPLAPGFYQVFLAGNSSTEPAVVADLNGTPLGGNASNPQGADFTETFQIDGIKGRTGPDAGSDDTPATAQELGDVTNAGPLLIPGAIGDDPYYNNLDAAHNPANDVDLYHFQISGPGTFAFVAEVDAGRIGSPLMAGLALYSADPQTGALQFIAGDLNTLNPAVASDGSTPLSVDPVLEQGLTAGSYYLAVADAGNIPCPAQFQPVGTPGLLDPSISHSAQNGFTTGSYVLGMLVQATPQPPQVIATYPAQNAVLTQPPTDITVQFSEPVNIEQQGYTNFLLNSYCSAPSVFVEGANGDVYYPRIDSYNTATNVATLLMFDRLAPGSYTLHLSSALGLADLGGNPLLGNDPSGDFVLQFTVTGQDLVQSSGSGQGGEITAQPGPDGSQDLGPLFPHELQSGAGINLVYTPGTAPAPPTAAAFTPTYTFTLLQPQVYLISLVGSDLPSTARLQLEAVTGQFVNVLSRNAGAVWYGDFNPGSYRLTVLGVSPDTPYEIEFSMIGTADNPVPLISGAAPALQLRFDTLAPLSTAAVSSGSSSGASSGGVTSATTGLASFSGSGAGPASGQSGASGGTSDPGGAATDNSTSSAGDSTSSRNETSGGPSSSSTTDTMGTTTAATSGPVAYTGTATTASPAASTTSSTAGQPTTVLIVNVPAEDTGPTLGSPASANSGTTGAPAGTAAVVASLSTAAAGATTQLANLFSGNLPLLGAGPVGGVQSSGSGSGSAGIQVVQVALPIPGNSPIPMGLLSVVTLTRAGDIGEVPLPEPPAELVVETRDVRIAAPSPVAAGSPRRHGSSSSNGSIIVASANASEHPVTAANDRAARDAETAATAGGRDRPGVVAPSPLAATAPGGDNPDLEARESAPAHALATASGPWLFLAAVLGTVTVYMRTRRRARWAAAADRSSAAERIVPAPMRLWGLGRSAGRRLPHQTPRNRAGTAAKSVSNASPRPRHLLNP